MIEILSEKNRRILQDYWFVREYFSQRTSEKKKILEQNLELFKSELLEKGIKKSDIEILKMDVPPEEFDRIIESLLDYAIAGGEDSDEKLMALQLRSEHSEVRSYAIASLRLLKSTKVIPLIRQMLKDREPFVRLSAVEFLGEVDPSNSGILLERMLEDSDEKIRSTSFYLLEKILRNKDIKSIDLLRVRNTGEREASKNILLGGKLTGVIIKVVSEPDLLAWKRALEAENIWKRAGFDYIPIEPIIVKKGKLCIYKTKDGNYRVYTIVFSSTYGFWEIDDIKLPHLIKDRMKELRTKIFNVLNQFGIEYNQTYTYNFYVQIDDNKIRLYATDFKHL